jgi:hypothetical protein
MELIQIFHLLYIFELLITHNNKDIVCTNILNGARVKGKTLWNLRVIASHSSSYWISYGPGLDGMSST